jgi:hypothetical protein
MKTLMQHGRFHPGWVTAAAALLAGSVVAGAAPDYPQWRMVELARFSAPEARQGVAADSRHLYVIGNAVIGKYDKRTFERVAVWEEAANGPIIHFNAGIVRDGRLIVAHSNYPGVPMTGSIEWFDPEGLQPVASHSFGIYFGSVTWVDQRDGSWFVCFAHYSNRAAEPNRDPTWTSLVRFDEQWRRTGGWSFPRALFEHIGGHFTLSGGAFGPGNYLYVTGHDDPELHVLRVPARGSEMEWIGTIPIQAEGQAFAWDPDDPTLFYSIVKRTREVIVSRLMPPE